MQKKITMHIERELAKLRVEWRAEGDPEYIYYCTDNYGEGIFQVNQRENSRRQLKGTLSFSMAGNTDKEILRIMQRRFRPNIVQIGKV